VAKRKGLVINDRQLDLCDDLLRKLKEVSGSTFLALISTSGQPITTASDDYHPETLSLASLAASSFAATQQLATILDEKESRSSSRGQELEPARLASLRPGAPHHPGATRRKGAFTPAGGRHLRPIFENLTKRMTAARDEDYEASAP
jgi:hypothetical protein